MEKKEVHVYIFYDAWCLIWPVQLQVMKEAKIRPAGYLHVWFPYPQINVKMFFSNLSNIFLWIINNLFVTYDVFHKWFETGCFEMALKH